MEMNKLLHLELMLHSTMFYSSPLTFTIKPFPLSSVHGWVPLEAIRGSTREALATKPVRHRKKRPQALTAGQCIHGMETAKHQ
jgi:hypothetical protein